MKLASALGSVRRAAGVVGFTALIVFLFAPAIVVAISSFTSAGFAHFPPEGFSTRWYEAIFEDDRFVESGILSLKLGVVTAVVSTTLGSLVAFTMHRYQFFGRNLLETLFMAPLAIPGLVLGIGLLELYSSLKITPSFWTLLTGHLLITVPFSIRMMSAALATFDANVERAAASLGANYATVLRTVTLPLLRTGVFGSLVFTFIVSFDEVSVSLFLTGLNTTTLPVNLYGFIEENATPVINSVSTVLLLLGVVALWAVERTIGLQKAFGAE